MKLAWETYALMILASYFSSSGREDVDVRMLGSGRPFMAQLMNPKRVLDNEKLSVIQREICEANREMIAVSELQIVTRLVSDLGIAQ